MPVIDRSGFEKLYAGTPRWDIDRPQKAFLDVAGQVTGSILDSGCGTGEIALHFASRGHRVTGIDFLAEPIQRAKQKAAERGVTATFLVMDALTTACGSFPASDNDPLVSDRSSLDRKPVSIASRYMCRRSRLSCPFLMMSVASATFIHVHSSGSSIRRSMRRSVLVLGLSIVIVGSGNGS